MLEEKAEGIRFVGYLPAAVTGVRAQQRKWLNIAYEWLLEAFSLYIKAIVAFCVEEEQQIKFWIYFWICCDENNTLL